MVKFPVSAEKQAQLAERMRAVQLAERDLEETYLRANAVALLHRPTGVRVRCGRERSQALNRFLVRRLLLDELEARQQGKTRHGIKAERLREEKDRRERRHHGRRPGEAQGGSVVIARDPLGGAHLFAPSADPLAAYFLRPLAP